MKDYTGKFYSRKGKNKTPFYAKKQCIEIIDNCVTSKIFLYTSTESWEGTIEEFKIMWVEARTPYKNKNEKPFNIF